MHILFFSKKTILISSIIAFVILNIVLLFITGVFPSENLPLVQKPTPTPIPDVLLATVGDKKISRSTVEKAAEEQYLKSAISNEVLKDFLEITIEREILDKEATALGITILQGELNDAMKKSALGEKGKLIVKYKLLKDKIIKRQLQSIDVYSVGFWIPPFSYPKLPIFDSQRREGRLALNEAERLLKSGETALSVGRTLSIKYPSLKDIMAVNGFLLKSTTDQKLMTTPRTYVVDNKNSNNVFFDTIFSLQEPGEIMQIPGADGSGGSVVKVEALHSGMTSGYNAWLAEKKQQQVKIINQI